MVAVASLNFSVYEQYTSSTGADGTTRQTGTLNADVTVGTDDGSKYGSAIILDVDKAPATKKLSDGLKAVNTLTQVANYARTQAPKNAAASRLSEAIGELRTLDLYGGGIRAVEQAARVAQDIASAVRDLAAAEEAIAAEGGTPDPAATAGAGAAEAAAASAALDGSSSETPAVRAVVTTPTAVEASYSNAVGGPVTGLIAGATGLGSGAAADRKASSGLAQSVIAALDAAGLPVDGSSLTRSLQDLIDNPVLGAQELQASAKQAGLDVTVASSLDVSNSLTDPRLAAASGVTPGTIVGALDDPIDGLIQEAVAALGEIGKGLRKVLPPLLNSPDKKIAKRAKQAEDEFGQAVADTVKAISDYYNAKAEVVADGGADNAAAGDVDATDLGDGTAGAGDAGTAGSADLAGAGVVAASTVGIRVSVDIRL